MKRNRGNGRRVRGRGLTEREADVRRFWVAGGGHGSATGGSSVVVRRRKVRPCGRYRGREAEASPRSLLLRRALAAEDGLLSSVVAGGGVELSRLVSGQGGTVVAVWVASFEKGGDDGAPSECDNKFRPNNTPVVALSTRWFNNKYRCLNYITIHENGRRVKAKVVDECDSTMGCDADHDYQPACRNNIVDASKTVWKALGVPQNDWGELDIYWSDA
ncbi:putative ripening-related protein 2 [Juglans regia]|uniref:Ripening-related protein 2 n=1 Tax=Juglans regia TaxID=51240 RepID=A0A6P9EY55_JUGRE|nr:putative ripening-related protein 2 [Juglans regia]